MQTGGLAISGLILLFVFFFGQSAWYVRGYKVQADTAETTFYLTLEAERKVLGDLSALGADPQMLDSLWQVYTSSPPEERMTNAMRLLAQLDTTVKAVEQSEQAMVKGHKLHMARQRLNRVRKVHQHYKHAMIAWEEAADSNRGAPAVGLGLVNGPD